MQWEQTLTLPESLCSSWPAIKLAVNFPYLSTLLVPFHLTPLLLLLNIDRCMHPNVTHT